VGEKINSLAGDATSTTGTLLETAFDFPNDYESSKTHRIVSLFPNANVFSSLITEEITANEVSLSLGSLFLGKD
jgi:hypothetical protein